MIKVGSQFSGVGAFEQSLKRLGIEYDNIYAADIDKYARQTYLLNFEEPKYYIKDVHDTPIKEITEKHGSLDIAMFSPPCQAFSLAGKRLGKEDKRGILFFNSLEFIQENKPRYFIFENVKGLLSHDKQDKNAEYGRTFQEWINYLGGKSVNGVHTFFPIDDSVPYHIYFQVLNAKHYGIPQNRERIFIIGIRDDEDNNFQFPKPFPLTKRLKDILEPEVDEKYFLSDKMLDYLTTRKDNFNNGNINFKDENSVASTITKSSSSLDISDNIIRLGNVNPSGNGMNGNVFHEDGVAPTLSTNKGEGIKIASSFGNKRLDETLNSKEVPEEDCIIDSYNKTFHTEVSPCISTRTNASSCTHVKIGAIRGRNPQNQKSRESGLETEQMLEINENGTSNALTTVQKDNVVVYDLTNDFGEQTREYTEYAPSLRSSRNGLATNVEYTGVAVHPNSKKLEFNGFKDENCPTLLATDYKAPKCIQYNTQRIRRLTPLECFRLMDFNEDFIEKTINSNLISDSQLYKMAGNSICVGVLSGIIKKLNL